MTTAPNAAPEGAAFERRASLAADLRFVLLAALALAAFPFVLHPIGGYAGLATQILITSIAAVAFNLLLGYAGMLSYGQAMFYGGGGYVAAILLLRAMPQHPNLWLAVLGATLVTAVMALLVGAVTVRLYGIYFALLTLAFAQMVFFIGEGLDQWRRRAAIDSERLLTDRSVEHRPHAGSPSARSGAVRQPRRHQAVVHPRGDRAHRRPALYAAADPLAVRRSADGDS
jgi:hypothetical protein